MATKKKIAHPKPRTKRARTERITRSDVQRKNSDKRVQVGAIPSAGMTLGEVLKAGGHPTRSTAKRVETSAIPARSSLNEQPVDADIRRAAERIGIPAPTVLLPGDAAEKQLAFLKDHLVRATDLVSESIAGLVGQGGDEIDIEGVHDNLSDVLLALWRIRWECYQTGGAVRAEHTAGGAS